MKYLYFLSVICLSFACNGSKKVVESADNTSSKMEGKKSPISELLSLEVGPCFGYCPVYKLVVLSNGRMVLDAKRFMDIQGLYELQLGDKDFKAFKRLLGTVPVASLDNEYDQNLMDVSMKMFQFYQPNKLVKYKVSACKELDQVQAFLQEKIKDHKKWRALLAQNDNAENSSGNAPSIKQLIIEFNTVVEVDDWASRYSGYDLRMVRPLSPNGNMFLFQYKDIPSLQSVEAMIRQDRNVRRVEPINPKKTESTIEVRKGQKGRSNNH